MQGSSSSKSRVQAFNTPRSLQALTEAATLPPLSDAFTPMSYYRSIESLVKQASAYLTSPTSGKVSSRSQEEAYVLLLKAATLAIVQLPKHPAFTSKLNAERRKMLANQSQNILAQLSELKPVIQKRRAQWETNNPPETVEPPSPPEVVFPDTDEPCSGPTSLKRRIAVRHQFDAASAAQQPTSSASNRQSSASSQRTAPSQPSNTEKRTSSLQEDPSVPAMDHLVDVPAWKPPEPTAPPSHKFDSAHQDQQGFIPSRAQASIVYPYLPSRPKDPRASRPSKEVYSATSVPKNAEVSIPKLSGLRRLTLPSTLIDSFVALAWHNTEQKIETCGLLLGQLNAASDELQVKTLLIPKQKGRSDSCEMIDEEEIFEAQEARQLLTLGWIHTHPVQSCFLSSVDLRLHRSETDLVGTVDTHCAYQISLPEAIAVVCAPNHDPSVGIFRLTDPPGLGLIMSCKEKGFHPHAPAALYTDADASAGHVSVVNANLELLDLRSPQNL